MDCPGVDTMAQLVCGVLPGGGVDAVESHLAGCRDCRELRAALASSALSRVTAPVAGAAVGAPRFLCRGERLDRYTIRECLGAGGMGIVYAAHDSELERDVALKVLRPELAGERELLVTEARAAARVHHPNVITVHEVGTAGDDVFIAMALCRGGTLRRWLGTRRTIPEILALAADIGRGLAAAHKAGLVHCDFKPDNVLLDDDGRPLVSDFGLARPAGATGGGGGTPAYMAPEQRAGAAPHALADQYAFCLVLRESLADGRESLSGRPERGASTRRLEGQSPAAPRWLTQAIERGLAPEPSARWPSMDALVDVLARDHGRRRRRLLAGAAAMAVAAGAAIVVAATRPTEVAACAAGDAAASAWSADDAARVTTRFEATGAPFARDAAAAVVRELDGWRTRWAAIDLAGCRDARRHGNAAQRDRQATCLARSARDVAALVDVLAEADVATVERAVATVERSVALDGCADPLALAAEVPEPPPAVRGEVEALRARLARSRALRRAGHDREALPDAERVAAAAAATGYPPLEAEAWLLVGKLRHTVDDTAGAESALRAAAAAADAGRDDRARAAAWLDLGHLMRRTERDAELSSLLDLLDGLARRLDGERALIAEVTELRGDAERARGNFPAALAHARAALAVRQAAGHEGLAVANGHYTVGATLNQMGRSTEALSEFERALALTRGILGEHHPQVARILHARAQSETNLGRSADARATLERVLAIREAYLGPDHRGVALTRGDLALILTDLDERTEALRQIELSLTTLERVLGPSHSDVGIALAYRGDIHSLEDRFDLALADYARAIELTAARAPDHPRLADLHARRADALKHAGRLDEALAAATRAHALRTASFPAGDPALAYGLQSLGLIHLARRDPGAALPLLEQALTLRTAPGRDPLELATTQFALARTLRLLRRDPTRARSLATAARATFAAMGPAADQHLADADAFLRE